MKGNFLLSIFIFSSFGHALATPCTSALRDKILDRLGRTKDSVVHELKRQDWNRSDHVNSKQLNTISKILKNYDLIEVKDNRWVDIINHVYLELRIKEGKGKKTAEKMANIFKDIESQVNKIGTLSIETKTLFALGILRLESFKKKDYIKSNNWILSKKKDAKYFINFGEFSRYTKSYIERTELYESLPNEMNVLSALEYRALVANNHWPVLIKDHDIRHIHYGLSHPKVLAIIFTGARSKNKKRFFLLSSLFEGVDTVQYIHETEITSYFRKKGFGLEEAMIHIATANNKRLDQIISNSGPNTVSIFKSVQNFSPVYGGEIIDTLGSNNRRFDIEIDQLLENQHELLIDNIILERPVTPSIWYYERMPHKRQFFPVDNGADYIW